VRGLQRLKPGGLAIVNDQRIMPSSVTYGTAVYPEDAQARVRAASPDAVVLDALAIAEGLGNARAVNSVLMGVLAKRCGLPLDCWEQAIRTIVKPRFVEMNLAAFAEGLAFSV
jgi:indolepyruvate ferredoxin oxidoreductase beta subunit